MEQHGDQRRRIHVDFLGEIRQRGALPQTDGLAVTGGDAHTADDRCFQLFVFVTLRQTVLASLRGLAALTAEGAGCAAATTAATARWTVAWTIVLEVVAAVAATETVTTRTTATAACTLTMLTL